MATSKLITASARRAAAPSGHAVKGDLAKPPNHCFGCGADNPEGLQLKFTLSSDGASFVCRFRLARKYVGPPGHAHGGIIATILDEAMGKANRLRKVVALTREMTVEYLRPVPLGVPLVVEGRNRSSRGRIQINFAEIRNRAGEVLARSRGKFITIDPEKMFAKYLKGKKTGGQWKQLQGELEKK